jgi:hypothetical protein
MLAQAVGAATPVITVHATASPDLVAGVVVVLLTLELTATATALLRERVVAELEYLDKVPLA